MQNKKSNIIDKPWQARALDFVNFSSSMANFSNLKFSKKWLLH